MSTDAPDLLVLLHGRGADEEDLLPIARAVAPAAEVLAPRAPFRWGPGFAWEAPDADVAAGLGLAAAAAQLLPEIDAADAGRVLLLGFSQGGAVAVELLRARPAAFTRVVLLSAFVADPDRTDPLVAARRPAVLWGRGAEDPLFDQATLDGAERWLTAHTALDARVYPRLAHGVSEAEVADVAAFLAG